MSNKIKITVGVTTYNRPAFLKEAVNSVLSQSFSNFELIISNDYQKRKVSFRSLGLKKDPRIKIVNQQENLGEIDNLNYILKIAKSNWFIWLADDDLIHPDFLLTAEKEILKNKDYKIAAFFSNYLASNIKRHCFLPICREKNTVFLDFLSFLRGYSSKKISLIGVYGVMNTDCLRRCGGILKLGNSFSPYSDTLLPIYLARQGIILWLDEPLVLLRTHPESLSYNSSNITAYVSAEIDFLKHLNSLMFRVCRSQKNKIVANFIQWFSINQWSVLEKDNKISCIEKIKKFLQIQFEFNFPRLIFKFKLKLLLFLLIFLLKKMMLNFFVFLKKCIINNKL